MEFPTHFR